MIFIVESFADHVLPEDKGHFFTPQVVALVLFDLIELLVTEIVKYVHFATPILPLSLLIAHRRNALLCAS
jgi:hypothetical protein